MFNDEEGDDDGFEFEQDEHEELEGPPLGNRINPKNYPFNYIVHDGDEIPFEKYGEAVAFIKANYPGCLIDEFWFGPLNSDNDFNLIPDSPGSSMDFGKYVWKSPDDYSRLLTWMEKARNGDCDELFKLVPDAADEFCVIGALLHEATVCVLERRRDAYDQACMENY